jgi:Ca2+-binding RTX toxin-like protein
VNLSLGTSTSAQTGNDTLSQVEGVIGSAAADTLTGDGNANYLDGGGANDTINGGGGADTLTGGAGADTIDGGDGDDTIIYTFGDGVDVLYNGGIGNDTLRINGTAGANTLTSTWDGARLTSFNGTALQNIEAVRADLLDGSDRLSYAGTLAAFGVTVNLATNTATGYASIANIENVTGGAGADSITGNDNANDLDGGNGADTLDGGAGDDNLGGGGANDVLIGGLGNDVMAGGGGLDTFVFSGAFGSDTISDFDENPTGGQDLLDISAFGVTAATFASLVNIAQVGANVVITINGQTITLLGETAANITSADFIL